MPDNTRETPTLGLEQTKPETQSPGHQREQNHTANDATMPSIEEIGALMKERKWCFYISDEQIPGVYGYCPAIVIEGVPGLHQLSGNDDPKSPWYWGKSIEKARHICQIANSKMGISEEVCALIIASAAVSN